MKRNRITALILAGAMSVSLLAGCGNSQDTGTSNSQTSEEAETAGDGSDNSDGVVDLEVWTNNNGFLEVKKGGELYNFYKDLFGVGVTQPYVEWNGGSTYQEQLNLRIAANEMPDIFMPVNGMEADLAKNGALLDLTDLLPEKAPKLWNAVPEEVWNIIKTYDPTGEGRIYMVPCVIDYARMGAIIRQDWLDTLGLEMPTTQDEFVEVLRAFKEQDPNGNGVADEIPAGGRAEARWMDYLFSMYGIAMWEGYPQWDIYDGELTYAGVTQNMKDALAFIRELYAEGLLDPETLLNDKAGWDGKINSNTVGVYYHWAQSTYEYATNIQNSIGIQPDLAVMPPISAEGYDAFYTQMQVGSIQWVVKNTDDEAKIDAVMKLLNAYGDSELWETFFFGVPGMHCEEQDGKLVKLPEDKKTQENLILLPMNCIATIDSTKTLLESIRTDETAWAIDQSIDNLSQMDQYGKTIAGDGVPSTVYEGYADIQNRTLYVEYATKIIVGEYPIDKFDEFVEKWYASGGEAVTQAAREWYAQVQEK